MNLYVGVSTWKHNKLLSKWQRNITSTNCTLPHMHLIWRKAQTTQIKLKLESEGAQARFGQTQATQELAQTSAWCSQPILFGTNNYIHIVLQPVEAHTRELQREHGCLIVPIERALPYYVIIMGWFWQCICSKPLCLFSHFVLA